MIAHQPGDMIHSTLPLVPVHRMCQLQAPDGLVSCWWVWWVESNKHLGRLRGQVLHHNNQTYTHTSATSATPYCSTQYMVLSTLSHAVTHRRQAGCFAHATMASAADAAHAPHPLPQSLPAAY
jgi:hypothetical protein